MLLYFSEEWTLLAIAAPFAFSQYLALRSHVRMSMQPDLHAFARNTTFAMRSWSCERLCNRPQAYRRLLSMVKTPPDYPAFSYLKHGNVVPLTYSQFVRQFKLWLTLLEVGDKDLYSSHSFRRGGATFAFQCGVSPSLIKCQGDWSSDCYLKYISLTMADKLVTTRMMADRIGQLHL